MTDNTTPTSDARHDASHDASHDAHAQSTEPTVHGERRTGARGPDPTGLASLVRDDEPVAATCPYCERPFGSQDAHDLHVGDAHDDACTPAEREAYEHAFADEEDELFYFHLRVVAALAVLYTVLTLLYMVALGSGIL